MELREMTQSVMNTEDIIAKLDFDGDGKAMWRGRMRTADDIRVLEELRRKAYPHLYEDQSPA
jgi:hypothetical protein